MAKRRKLEAPSAADLSRLEAEIESGAGLRPAAAPIAQVAGEAASERNVLGAETRARLEEAKAYREADEKGLVMREIPIDRIRADELVRDRAVIDRDELTELRASIVQHGLRLPIEVYELPEKTAEHDYGLVSGYRRLMAMREAWSVTQLEKYRTIRAMVRAATDSAESIAAMVEENEIRAEVSNFERGRIAALSAQNSVFVNVEEAVAQLFPFASKAKRSKIRSFALIFEELGDALAFPEALSERQGLAVAAALRAGAEQDLRDLLVVHPAETAKDEWEMISGVLEKYEDSPRDRTRGGRPNAKAKKPRATEVDTPRGVTIAWEPMARGGFTLRLKGKIAEEEVRELVSLMQVRLG